MKQIVLWLVMLSSACVTVSKKDKSMDIWYKGSVEEAFVEAEKSNKPLFLYWGAVWCPPCNEIKSEVFSKPRFAELMDRYIPVYLDGDTDQAQIWADKLQAYGYPTILILDHKKKELMRLSSGVNLKEFEIALAGSQNNSLEILVDKAKDNQLHQDEWRSLAYAAWGQLPEDTYPAIKKWQIMNDLVRKVPKSYKLESSLICSQYLVSGASLDKKEFSKEHKETKKSLESCLAKIFENHQTLTANRAFINGSGADILSWAYPDFKDKDYLLWKNKWLKAADMLADSDSISVDTRLWAVYPHLEFFKQENKEAQYPNSIKSRVESAVSKADQEAKSKYERHSVISGAAYLLRLVGSYEKAKGLLLKELELTDTPWYYQSSLSSLASARGLDQEALQWSEKARKSAKGRATRLQWISNDLLLTAKLEAKDQRVRLLSLVGEYYELATQLKDGFSGRNQFRAKRVSDSLQKWKKDGEFRQLIATYKGRCDSLQGQSLDNCRKHFGSLL